MNNKQRPEMEKLRRMTEARKAGSRKRRLVIGVDTPSEIRDALIKSSREKPDTGLHVLLQRERRTAFNNLANELDIPTAELLRLIVDASVKLGPDGVCVFIDAANKAEDIEAVFKKASDDAPEGKKSRGSLKERLDKLTPDDPDAPEREEDQADDDKKRKRKKKKGLKNG